MNEFSGMYQTLKFGIIEEIKRYASYNEIMEISNLKYFSKKKDVVVSKDKNYFETKNHCQKKEKESWIKIIIN